MIAYCLGADALKIVSSLEIASTFGQFQGRQAPAHAVVGHFGLPFVATHVAWRGVVVKAAVERRAQVG